MARKTYLERLTSGTVPAGVKKASDLPPKLVAAAAAQDAGVAELRAATSLLLERIQFMRQAGISFQGARDLYQILGYDRILTNRQYRDRYARGGLAGRVVDVLPNATWRGTMEVVEDKDEQTNTLFEQDWKDLEVQHQVSAKLMKVDKLSQLSTYAVLLIGALGDLSSELPTGTPGGLLFLQAFSGGGGPGGDANSRALAADADCTIEQFEVNPESPRFGQPLSYRLKRTDISSPALARAVHYSRILHVAEGCLWDDVYGLPSLERVWNLFDDLDKTTGGGAEAFWLRANQGLHLNIDKDMQLPDAKDAVAALKDQSEEYKHQLTRWIRTRGVDVKTLGSDVANFSDPADAIITQIAGSKGIPKRILTGSEMGELASSQDRDNWKDQVDGRQTGYAGPYIIRPLVDRLIKYGYLRSPTKGPRAYEVKWPHQSALSEQEKADGAKKWADTNQAQGQPVFTPDEIRDKWYSLPALTEEQKAAAAPQDPNAQPDNVLPEETTPEDAVDQALSSVEDAPEARAAGGFGSGVVGHDTPGRQFGPTRGGAPHVVPGKDKETAQQNAKRAASHLESKGFKSSGGGKFINTTTGKSVTVTIRPNFGLAITPLRVAEDLLPPQPRNADEAEMLKVLTAAIEVGNLDVIDRILGVKSRMAEGFKLSSTQIQMPQGVADAIRRLSATIPYEDLNLEAGGREDDIHVTVKYGLTTDDPSLVRSVVAGVGAIDLVLGPLGTFEGEEYDVVFATVKSPELVELNATLSNMLDVVNTHPGYVPHVTVAYVVPGVGRQYAGRTDLVGETVHATSMIFSTKDGTKTEISFA